MLTSETDIRTSLPLWEVDTQKQVIARTFVFADFVQAFEFMTQCAQYANEIDHHPDWSNSWNKVVVHLSTHSAGKITKLDIDFAQKMDILAAQINAHPPHDLLR
jgi:4a-hydroxytetrahydrobiopterin dehydratase